MIRHITFLSNAEKEKIIDPLKVKHCEITALKISNLSGWIDPQTHLNLDFPNHLIRIVYVAEKLEIGGKIILEGDTFMRVLVDPKAYKRLGMIDETERIEELKQAYHEIQTKTNK
jgi:hypothetical protein